MSNGSRSGVTLILVLTVMIVLFMLVAVAVSETICMKAQNRLLAKDLGIKASAHSAGPPAVP